MEIITICWYNASTMNLTYRIREFLLIILMIGVASISLHPQSISQLEFRDQPIPQILSILAETAGVSIIPDNTVTGTASYYFTQTNFEEALELFLSNYKLHYRKEMRDGRAFYYVSRILTSYDEGNNLLSIEADDVELQLILRAISKAIGTTVLYDPLPADRITINSTDIAPQKALEMIIARFDDFELTTDEDYYYIKRKPHRESTSGGTTSGTLVEREGESYSINAESARFFDLVNDLFGQAEKEYALMLNNDAMLKNLFYSYKNFDETLRLILEQANADYTVYNDIYYIFQVNNRDILNNYKSYEIIPLKYITAQELPQLIPNSLNSSGIMKLNNEENIVILSGSISELRAIKEFIPLIDKPVGDMVYYRYTFQKISAEKIQSLLPSKYQKLSPTVHTESNSVIFRIPRETEEDLNSYLDILDASPTSTPVTLKYLKSEDLLENLPPSIGKDHIAVTANPSLILFTGPAEKRKDFLAELSLIDTPVPQIRYDLLIIQYQESTGFNREFSLSNSVIPGDSPAGSAFVGSIGKLLDMNFDIITNFGYQFAMQLQAELTENMARVMADTTLNGLSGEEVKFQNTDTYRYVEGDVDEEGNEVPGVTRELSSGLFLNIKGWVSGDGMITMDISSTISKTDENSDPESSILPPTSERVINTHVRTKSGKPVIIGGLLQQETKSNLKKIPVLSSIPLLGKLFTWDGETTDNTELSIYIVPSVEYSIPRQAGYREQIEKQYKRFILEGY